MYEAYAILALFYCLGFIGLAAFGLLPVRLWEMFEFISKIETKNKIKIFIAFFTISFISIYIETDALKSIHKCIMDFKCGPNRGNRWIHLALLGSTYIIVELLFIAMKALHRRYLKNLVTHD